MARLLKGLTRAHDALTDVSYQFAKLCLGIIVFAYCYEVASRYFFNAPTWGADEAVSYSLGIGCFTMMPYVTREKGHVAVTLIVDMLAPKNARPVYWFIYLLGFLACAAAACCCAWARACCCCWTALDGRDWGWLVPKVMAPTKFNTSPKR